jgi:hypothetical protein
MQGDKVAGNEIAWLAGFLEAEGCFTLGTHHRKRDNRFFRWISLSAVSTDEDVIRRAASILHTSVLPPRTRKRSFGTKPIYGLSISGNKAAHYLPLLYPHMGERRGQRTMTMLAHWESRAHKYKAPKFFSEPALSSEEDSFAWLAGFLEGEGSFVLKETARVKSETPRIEVTICVTSTDEDVLRKAALIMGSNTRSRKPRGISKKLQWETALTGERAIAIMRRILPDMGQRRSGKILKLLSLWNARSVKKYREPRLPPSCHPDRKHIANGLCSACYAQQKRPERADYFRNYRRRNRAIRTAYNRDWRLRQRDVADRVAGSGK